jgi:3-hydroxyisobutyrate dehydrogenase-like beta-hydroxyacid dehydrogenase
MLSPNMSKKKPQPVSRLAIIGFGEAGGIFGEDFARRGIDVSVFDTLLNSKGHRPQMLAKARACGVRAANNFEDCVRDAELVISAVTASSTLDVAKKAAALVHAGQIFLDINSVSPETKRKAAKHFAKRSAKVGNAHFVEAAVMAAIPGQRLKVPMLLGGAHAEEASARLRSLGMNATALSDQVGVASAVKMCRSVIMKGLEALAVECLLAARCYGAEDKVLESLAATYAGWGWDDRLPDYLISRVAEHGLRRAAEMREVARTLHSVGITPTMSFAAADRQEKLVREMAARGLQFDPGTPFSWRSLADTIARKSAPRSKKKILSKSARQK